MKAREAAALEREAVMAQKVEMLEARLTELSSTVKSLRQEKGLLQQEILAQAAEIVALREATPPRGAEEPQEQEPPPAPPVQAPCMRCAST